MSDEIRISNGDGEGWRTQPMYTISEAAHLAHVSSTTVRRWLFGDTPDPRYPDYKTAPVFGNGAASPYVSFLSLIEIVAASDFRKVSHLKLEVVRRAHRNLKAETGIDYPFAHVQLETLGDHIIRWLQDGKAAEAVDAPQQRSIPGLVAERIHRSAEQIVSELEYFRELAARWYPVGKDVPVVVDPRFAAGLPTIDGRGVTVDAIRRRWLADQKIEFIADDLQLDVDVVERALQYADKIAA